MSKVVQAFLSGAFFTFFLDFFFILGLKISYIDYYDFDLYYNPFFADTQNIYIYMFFTLLFGLLISYIENTKLNLIVIGGLLVLSLTTLVQPVGHAIASSLFMQKNVTLHTKRFTYVGDIYYDGRTSIHFYDKELQKLLVLQKEEIIHE